MVAVASNNVELHGNEGNEMFISDSRKQESGFSKHFLFFL